jgi:hypothetical protein
LKTYRFYLVFLLGLFVCYVLLEYYRPKPIDWNESYSSRDKIPYGTRLFFELLPTVFPGQSIRPTRLPIYNTLTDNELPKRSTYIFINKTFKLDRSDLKELLQYVQSGNTAFVAATRFSPLLLDTLHLKVESPLDSAFQVELTGTINFTNPQLRAQIPYVLKRSRAERYFTVDSANQSKVVGLGISSQDSTNFVKIPFGKGFFYLHTEPAVFCNYTLVSEHDYAFKAISYLPVSPVYWDEYQKQGREGERSIFRVIFSKPPLQWAYWAALVGILMYVFFEGKRRQRIIPVLEKPQNTSLEFVETIGRLYFEQQNHRNIADKKIAHFLSFVRQRYLLPTQDLNADFVYLLSKKSGFSTKELTELVTLIEQTRQTVGLTEGQLIELSQKIEDFYRHV